MTTAAELIIRNTGDNEYTMEVRWLDTENRGTIKFQVDPRTVSLANLFEFAEKVREAGEQSANGTIQVPYGSNS